MNGDLAGSTITFHKKSYDSVRVNIKEIVRDETIPISENSVVRFVCTSKKNDRVTFMLYKNPNTDIFPYTVIIYAKEECFKYNLTKNCPA